MTKLIKNLLLVTGMSGAGKSVALNALEDLGYYCIDNMPVILLKHIASLTSEQNQNYNNIENFAIVVDSRSQDFENFIQVLTEMKQSNQVNSKILFLECNDEVLVKRFKETRRTHPLSKKGSIHEGIVFERSLLNPIREIADYIIDTSYIGTNQFKKEISQRFITTKFDLAIMSFGFKHGSPNDCDYVFDVRFLPNPFYIEELRELTGLDKQVADYVIEREETQEFLDKVEKLLEFVIPLFEEIAKNQVLIGIGCSGGQHRSVAIAEKLYEHLQTNYQCRVWHRDLDKNRRD